VNHIISGEALVFCRAETAALLLDHILHARPDTLSDAKVTGEVEMHAKYTRTVGASLAAVVHLITAVPIEAVTVCHAPPCHAMPRPARLGHAKEREELTCAAFNGRIS
jgi:hypothetical protein